MASTRLPSRCAQQNGAIRGHSTAAIAAELPPNQHVWVSPTAIVSLPNRYRSSTAACSRRASHRGSWRAEASSNCVDEWELDFSPVSAARWR